VRSSRGSERVAGLSGPDDQSGRSADPDDWFASGRPAPRPRTREREDVEVAWVEEEPREAAEPLLPAGLNRRRLAVLGAVAFIVIVGVAYAASGLFGGSKSSKPPAQTPTTHPVTTTVQHTTPPPTHTTPPAKVPALTSGLLKQGTSGPDVKALQQALAAVGESPGKIDGVFGAQTETALVAFQKGAGISADGVYGPATKAALDKKLGRG
jgi:hypothetical protein